MNITQEPKYDAVDGRLVNRQSGQVIPDDEPVMVFRARDRHAALVISYYLTMVQDNTHKEAVCRRLRQFQKWGYQNPGRMKEPDTELTKDWENL